MKNILNIALLGVSLVIFTSVFAQEAQEKKKINWVDIETAQELNKKEPRKFIIDVYTNWCGWCKKMDAGAFSHPVIVDYINTHFYAVKLNAESKEEITFKGITYKNPNPEKSRPTHELASIAAVNGRLAYPTIVYIDENLDLLSQVPGFMDAKGIEPVLHFFAEEVYKSTSYEDFSAGYIPVSENDTPHVNSTKRTNNFEGKNIVKMKMSGGVYKIPALVNGSNMDFIFDTGASDITISLVEALFLYKQGTLTEDDFIGVQQYQIADGSISEGSIINLKTVQIGNKVLHNVKASIIHNTSAPLLLGQSALNQFGQITIDYKNSEITLE